MKMMALLLMTMTLAGCQQTMMSSVIRIKLDAVTDDLRSDLVKQVYEKATEHGGRCEYVARSREYHSCNLPINAKLYGLNVGFSPNGQYSIVIRYEHVHLLPLATRNKVLSGRYIPQDYKALESWIKSIVPKEVVEDSYRYYIAFDDFRESF